MLRQRKWADLLASLLFQDWPDSVSSIEVEKESEDPYLYGAISNEVFLTLAVVTSLWLWANAALSRYVVGELTAVVATETNQILSVTNNHNFI